MVSSFTVWIPWFWQFCAESRRGLNVVRMTQGREMLEWVSSSARSRTSGRRTERPQGPDTWATAAERDNAQLQQYWLNIFLLSIKSSSFTRGKVKQAELLFKCGRSVNVQSKAYQSKLVMDAHRQMSEEPCMWTLWTYSAPLKEERQNFWSDSFHSSFVLDLSWFFRFHF